MINRRGALRLFSRSAGAVAAMGATGTAVAIAAPVLTPRQRVEHHIAELQKALADLDMGPVRATVGSDHPPVIDKLAGKSFRPFRGVPASLWRVEA